MGDEAEAIFSKAAKQVIQDQEECGIDIITDGEVEEKIIYIIIVVILRV